MLRAVKEPHINNVLDFGGIAVSADRSQTIITEYDFAEFTGNQYKDAFVLQKNTILADTNEYQMPYIRESMQRRMLTKNTAFIVMESKEQEDLLLALQEQSLSGQSVATLSVMMSELVWAVILLLLGLVLLFEHEKQKRT
jgi:hypothetical protein